MKKKTASPKVELSQATINAIAKAVAKELDKPITIFPGSFKIPALKPINWS